MLEIEDLVVRYGKVPAVSGLSLDVREGEIVCIVGPNGAGKSTTLMTVAGELEPASGSVKFAGEDIGGRSVEQVVRLGVAMVPENRHIFGRMTVEENLRLATFARPIRDQAEADLDELISRFRVLKERRHAPAGRLSGGEQQQLAIARGLLLAPRLLLVDEPSLGLAPMTVELIYGMLRDARDQGCTLLVVEQSLGRALAVADRIYIVRGGRTRLQGTAAELADGAEAENAYFGTDADQLEAAR